MTQTTNRRLTTAAFIAVFLAGPWGIPTTRAQPTKGNTMSETDRAAIQILLDRYEEALNSADVDTVLDLYAADGVFMPSSGPTASGDTEIRASYTHIFSTIRLAIRFHIDEIVVDGNTAFARTGSKGTVTILAEQATVPEENRELFVFQKQTGEWKIVRYIFNKTS